MIKVEKEIGKRLSRFGTVTDTEGRLGKEKLINSER